MDEMRLGVTVGLGARAESTLEGLAERARQVEADGFASLWMPNAFGFDTVTALAVAGQGTSRIEIGTAVIPTYPRHPVVLAQQALTAQVALGGRFTLGVGLSHRVMMQDALGIPYERPAAHLREYLAVLGPLLEGAPAAFHGELFDVEATVTIPGAASVPVLVAALGPVMLRLAGARTEGTITSWVGPRTLEEHVVPTLTAAAAKAGRGTPRVVVGLPIALTEDPDGARALLADRAAWYATLPSYQAMFEREGTGPAGLALFGDEAALDAGLRRLADAGATEYIAQVQPVGPGTAERTYEYLASRVS